MPETVQSRNQPLELPPLSQNLVYAYYALAGLVLAGLLVAVVLGFRGVVGPGLFTPETAFAVAGIVVTILSLALVMLLFTLGTTILRIRSHLAQSIRLREAIETSYARLEETTRRLALQLPRLRTVLYEIKRDVAHAPARTGRAAAPTAAGTVQEATATLRRDLARLRGMLVDLRRSTPGNRDPSRN